MRKVIALLVLYTSLIGGFTLNVHAAEGSLPICSQIVSLAPSLTETLKTLRLEENLIGVSQFDLFDETSNLKSLPRVGGFLDPNLEAIVRMRPSLVVALEEGRAKLEPLERLGIRVNFFDHRNLDSINASVRDIGQLCDRANQAADWQEETTRLMDNAGQVVAKSRRVNARTVVVIGGLEKGTFYISGNDGFYATLLTKIGLHYPYIGPTVPGGTMGIEGLLSLNPEVVIEIIEPGAQKSIQTIAPFLKERRDIKPLLITLSDRIASIPSTTYSKLAAMIAEKIFMHEGVS